MSKNVNVRDIVAMWPTRDVIGHPKWPWARACKSRVCV